MPLIKNNIHKVFFIIALALLSIGANAQLRKSQNLPFADQKLYHFGFNLGMHVQDMPITHTGHAQPNGQVWFAEIPSYSIGFSVGMLADRYLNQYFNLRLSPMLHFGEKAFTFREQTTGELFEKSFRSNYFTIPLHLKFNAARIGNYRPYFIAGPYAAIDLSAKKNEALRFNSVDYGLEFGLGCNFYLPFFKLSPEIKFSLGLANIINTDRSDLADTELLPYSQAISSGKNRMISIVFNFE